MGASRLNCVAIGIVFVVCCGAAVDIDQSDYIALEICDVIIDRIIIRRSIPLSHFHRCKRDRLQGQSCSFFLLREAKLPEQCGTNIIEDR